MSAIMPRATKSKRKEKKEFGQPELTFTCLGTGPDPRFVDMVRLLARRAAAELYEQEQRQGQTARS